MSSFCVFHDQRMPCHMCDEEDEQANRWKAANARIQALEKDLAFQTHAAASWCKEAEDFEAERDAAHKKNKLLRSVLMTALLVLDDESPGHAAALRARLKDGE